MILLCIQKTLFLLMKEMKGDETESEDEVEQSVQGITLLNMSNEERTTYLAAQQAQLNALFNRLGLD